MANFYSDCQPLATNCTLYSDANLFSPVSAGFFADGINCYQTNASGKIVTISPCVLPCDLTVVSTNSTDPTTLGGTNGTITVVFTTSSGPSTYTLNGGPSLPATSPLVITGLSSNIVYNIVITDANSCTVAVNMSLGQTAVVFDADWLMVTYEFTNGLDLDTRTRIAVPNIGQTTQPQYLGWSCLALFPGTGTPILTWGNDNTGTGFESVLINITRFKELFPGESQFTVDMRAFWFNTLGTNPVNAAVTLWKGGTPVKDGCLVVSTPFCWTNPTAAFTLNVESVPTTITLAPTTNKGQSSGQRVATMTYNLNTFIAVLNNADVTTPSV